jgi:uncharacterized membrane protein YfcA
MRSVLTAIATGVLGAFLRTGGGIFLIAVLALGVSVPLHYAGAISLVSVLAAPIAVASTNVERSTASRAAPVLRGHDRWSATAGRVTASRATHSG